MSAPVAFTELEANGSLPVYDRSRANAAVLAAAEVAVVPSVAVVAARVGVVCSSVTGLADVDELNWLYAAKRDDRARSGVVR